MRKFFIFIIALEMILVIACSVKKEEPKDDFLGTKTEEPKKKEEPKTRIHVIDYGVWSYYQIIEVDGHEYLCNNVKGGIIHLESCPCKKKL